MKSLSTKQGTSCAVGDAGGNRPAQKVGGSEHETSYFLHCGKERAAAMSGENITSTTAPARDADKLLTLADVGERLQIGRTSVWKIIAEGGLRRVKFGKIVRVRESELQRWVEAHTAYAGAE